MNSAKSLWFFCITLAGIIACNGGHGNDTPSASTPSDTTTAQAAVSKEPEKPEYKSVDLQLFELYGPVRKCVFKNVQANEWVDEHVASRRIGKVIFDEKGRLICMNQNYISYPEKGPSMLTSYAAGGYYEVWPCYSLVYDRDAEGRLTRLAYILNHWYAMEYDEKGRTRNFLFYFEALAELKDSIVRTNEHLWPEVIHVENSTESYDDKDYPMERYYYEATVTYKYTQTDDHGNWTERTAVVEGKVNEDDAESVMCMSYSKWIGLEWKKFSTTYTDRREITYYE